MNELILLREQQIIDGINDRQEFVMERMRQHFFNSQPERKNEVSIYE